MQAFFIHESRPRSIPLFDTLVADWDGHAKARPYSEDAS